MSINNISIKAKLYINAFVLLSILVIATGYALSTMTKIGAELYAIAEEDLPTIEILTSITEHHMEQAISFERAMRYGELMAENSATMNNFKKAVSQFELHDRAVKEKMRQGEIIAEKVLSDSDDHLNREEFKHVLSELKMISIKHEEYKNHAEEIFMLFAEGKASEAERNAVKVEQEEDALNSAIVSLLNKIEIFTEQSALNAESHEQEAEKILTVLVIVAIISGITMSIFLISSIVGPMGKALAAMKDIAEGEGDLTQRLEVKGTDETAQVATAFNKFAEKIQVVVVKAKEASMFISSSSQQISTGNLNLSQRTEEQASSLEETASSMEEMTSTVKRNADNADNAAQLAQTVRDQAEVGGSVVAQAVHAMNAINESSKKISDIISVVEEIAFQTNLLALNAAVEAARAGDQGRGFAVVASEVRVLASRSAKAAKEIKGLIDDSVDKVKAGSELVDKSGETLQEIVVGIKKVNDIVFEIAAASQQQSSGIEQVNKAVSQMDEMTQQNAALVEESASASLSMEQRATEMKGIMDYFKTENHSSEVINSADSQQGLIQLGSQ